MEDRTLAANFEIGASNGRENGEGNRNSDEGISANAGLGGHVHAREPSAMRVPRVQMILETHSCSNHPQAGT